MSLIPFNFILCRYLAIWTLRMDYLCHPILPAPQASYKCIYFRYCIFIQLITEPSGSELMTYQQPSFSSANLNEFLAPDDQINPGILKIYYIFVFIFSYIIVLPSEDEEPDYLSHDLNTPKVERKNLSFRTRDN